jgi:UDP-N-acetyl-D-mannosaminuronic acid dehydrogenase
MTPEKIGIVGFGYIGCTIGAVLAERGHEVVGIDSNTALIDTVRAGKSPFNEPGLQELIACSVGAGRLAVAQDYAPLATCDVVLVTVGTPLSDDGVADLTQIRRAAEQMAPHLRDGQLVILKSTVPPTTTSEVVQPILRARADVLLAFCPERLAEGNAIRDLKSIPVVVGGVDERSTEASAGFWRRALGIEVITVANDRAAEMVKLADNLWIDLNIALANELAKLCDKFGLDALQVIDAANTLPKVGYNVNILVPSLGVGGYCLTKDPWFVHRMGQDMGIELETPKTSRRVNDGMPDYAVSLIDAALLKDGAKAGDLEIAVLGIAFKTNTGDCRFTPTKPAIEALQRRGYRLRICDPYVRAEDALGVTPVPLTQDIEAAVEGADCVAFFTGHDVFKAFAIERLAELAKPGALVFDGRMFFPREAIGRIESLGLRYKGVGR